MDKDCLKDDEKKKVFNDYNDHNSLTFSGYLTI